MSVATAVQVILLLFHMQMVQYSLFSLSFFCMCIFVSFFDGVLRIVQFRVPHACGTVWNCWGGGVVCLFAASLLF